MGLTTLAQGAVGSLIGALCTLSAASVWRTPRSKNEGPVPASPSLRPQGQRGTSVT
jgi:hypothetical protein